MIKCNLAVLLAERSLKITDVFKRTGISRSTLTSLYYNLSNGIQFDTLDKLCDVLGVTPGDLILYYPFKYQFSEVELVAKEPAAPNQQSNVGHSRLLVYLTAEIRNQKHQWPISVETGTSHDPNDEYETVISITYPDSMLASIAKIPYIFLRSLEQDLVNFLNNGGYTPNTEYMVESNLLPHA